jgi:hypothetical protein
MQFDISLGGWSCPVGRHPDGRAAPNEDVYRSGKFGFDGFGRGRLASARRWAACGR